MMDDISLVSHSQVTEMMVPNYGSLRLGQGRAERTRWPDSVGRSRPGYQAIKAVLGFLLAALLLALAAPVVVLAAVLVKLTSAGPAFYTQVRIGRNGRCYHLLKIRTMVDNCESETGPRWATPNDPRVTGIGRLLRAFHIDELPQLWNVVRGEMSLVGPRPERPEFVEQLEKAIPHYRERLLVRPGITGLAQLYLPPDSCLESVRRKLDYDRHYVRRISLGLDLRLLLLTGLYCVGISPRSRVGRLLLALDADFRTSTDAGSAAGFDCETDMDPAVARRAVVRGGGAWAGAEFAEKAAA